MSIELELSIPFVNLEDHIFCCLVCTKEVLFGEKKCQWCSNPLNWEGIVMFKEDKDNDDNDSESSTSDSNDEETQSEIAFRTGAETSDSDTSSSSDESCISLNQNDYHSSESESSDSDGLVLSSNKLVKRQRKY
jgi:hypothetical protein